MACGEGYGSAVLAERAAEVVGRRRQPRGARARAAALPATEPALRARAGRGVRGRRALGRDRVPADDRARRASRGALLERFASLLAPGGVAYVSTPEPPHARAAGRRDAPAIPWHVREYTPAEYRALLEPAVRQRRPAGPLPRAQAARPRAGAAARLGPRAPGAAADEAVLRPVRAGDRRARLRAARRRRSSARSTCSRSAGHELPAPPTAASSCIVLHSHMPYVEGFGTWPFGEEWLLEAMASSYLPLLRVLERRAERGGTAASRPSASRRCWPTSSRCPSVGRAVPALHARRAARVPPPGRRRARARRAARGRAVAAPLGARLRVGGGRLRAPRRRPARRAAAPARRGRDRAVDVGRHARRAAAARHRAGRAAAGRDRHRRAPRALRRVERRVLAAGVRLPPGHRGAARARRRARVLRGPDRSRRSARPARAGRRRRARSRCRSTGRRSRWCGTSTAIRPTRSTATTTRRRSTGCGRGPTAASPTTATRPHARAREHARDFVDRVIARADAYRAARGAARPRGLRARHRAARPLVVRGPAWLDAVIARGRPPRASRSTTLPGRARAPRARWRGRWRVDLGHRQGPAHLGLAARSPSSCGPRGRRSSTWWRRSARGRAPTAARAGRARGPRASCWRCSPATGRSWRTRGLAGDYPRQRVRNHAAALRRGALRAAARHDRLPRR